MLPRSYESQPSWSIARAREGVGGRVEDQGNRTGCRPVLDPRDVSRTGRVGATNP